MHFNFKAHKECYVLDVVHPVYQLHCIKKRAHQVSRNAHKMNDLSHRTEDKAEDI